MEGIHLTEEAKQQKIKIINEFKEQLSKMLSEIEKDNEITIEMMEDLEKVFCEVKSRVLERHGDILGIEDEINGLWDDFGKVSEAHLMMMMSGEGPSLGEETAP